MKIITVETLKKFLDELNKKYGTEFYSKVEADNKYQSKGDAYTKTESDGKFLTKTNAMNKYLTTTDAENKYLTKINAMGKYLTQSKAESTYVAKEDWDATFYRLIPPGGAPPVMNIVFEDVNSITFNRPLTDYYDKNEINKNFQKKGEYVTKEDMYDGNTIKLPNGAKIGVE